MNDCEEQRVVSLDRVKVCFAVEKRAQLGVLLKKWQIISFKNIYSGIFLKDNFSKEFDVPKYVKKSVYVQTKTIHRY